MNCLPDIFLHPIIQYGRTTSVWLPKLMSRKLVKRDKNQDKQYKTSFENIISVTGNRKFQDDSLTHIFYMFSLTRMKSSWP